MKINVCFAVILLVVALTKAGPAPKTIEKKSLTDNTKLETDLKSTDLKIEEAGEDKDRAKKSAATFCVEIKPGSSQATQVSCKKNQAAAQKSPLTIQTQTIPQQIQTFNVVQPVAQIPQASIVVPQPIVQPFQTLQIVQPAPQPCVQSAPAVNIIQSVPQTNIVQTNSKPKPKPKPTPAPVTEVKPTTEVPKPERIEQVPQPLPQPQETFSVLPIAPACHEQVFNIPSSPLILVSEPEPTQFTTVVQIPSIASCNNPLHGIISPCTCQRNVAVLSEPNMETMAMNVLPITSYSSSFPRSSFMMPYDSKMTSYTTQQEKPGAQSRTSTHVHVNVPAAAHSHHDQRNYHKIYQKMLIQGVDTVPVNPYAVGNLIDNMYTPGGIAINAYPQILREATSMQQPGYRSSESTLKNESNASNLPVASEANDLQQTNKVPREVDSNQLSPEKIQEIEEEKGRAFLIDGRRNTRSNKEETKTQKFQSAAN